MKTVVLLISILFLQNVNSQSVNLILPDLIELAKQRSLPVLCSDSSFNANEFKTGSGVLLGSKEQIYVLTCEHVIALKDSLNKTVRYLSDIYVNMNKFDSTSQSIEMVVVHTNEEDDFALLGIKTSPKNLNAINQLDFDILTPSNCLTTNKIEEGDPILYIGYPMMFGINKKNHPLSRTGIISQLIPNSDFFLIDGFVQHGHSGSPVFKIQYIHNSNQWTMKLIGITTSYPAELGRVLQKVKFKTKSGLNVELNPGFTYVTSMNKIIPVLKNNLKMK